MVTLRDRKDPAKKRVLLGRSIRDVTGSHPLLIDPEKRAVTVLGEGVGDVVSHDGAAYWVGVRRAWREKKRMIRVSLARMGFPDFKAQVVFRDRELSPEDGHVKLAFHGGKIHVVGQNWWVAPDFKSPFRRLAGHPSYVRRGMGPWGNIPGRPYLRRLCRSSHYGLILIGAGRVFQVNF